jgi:hypothetical protein
MDEGRRKKGSDGAMEVIYSDLRRALCITRYGR